jgi:hypothetical protein
MGVQSERGKAGFKEPVDGGTAHVEEPRNVDHRQQRIGVESTIGRCLLFHLPVFTTGITSVSFQSRKDLARRSGRSPSSESACVFTFEFVRHRLRAFQRQDLWVLLVHSWTNIGQHQHPLRGSQSVRMDKRSGTKRPDQGTWFGLLTLVSRVRILPAPPHGTSASWGRVKVA